MRAAHRRTVRTRLFDAGGVERARRPQRPDARAHHRPADGAGHVQRPRPIRSRQTMYKSLMSELGVVIAPRALSPADTLGYSGFQLAFETSFTQISNTQDFWQKGVENVSGELPADDQRDGAQGHLAAAARLRDRRRRHQAHRQQHVRGAGATPSWRCTKASTTGPSRRWRCAAPCRTCSARRRSISPSSASTPRCRSRSASPAPSRSIPTSAPARCSASCAGRSSTPRPASTPSPTAPGSIDINANTTFPDPDTIVRWRIYAGFRLVYAFLALTGEFVYTFCNDSGDRLQQDGRSQDHRPLGRSGADQLLRLVLVLTARALVLAGARERTSR